MADFRWAAIRACSAQMGESHINTQILRAGITDSRSVWIAALAIPLMLLAPALWNGYPLLQWDTGGYLARWYEGYLVPSHSTVFGLYLHFGETFGFLDQSRDTGAGDAVDRAADAAGTGHGAAVAAAGDRACADPDHGTAVSRQHAADRHLARPFGAVALYPGPARRQGFRRSKKSRCLPLWPSPRRRTAERWRCCSDYVASVGWRDPSCAGGFPSPDWRRAASPLSLVRPCCCRPTSQLSGQLAWTPGGYGVAFGRMLQDGIVTQYLQRSLPAAKAETLPRSRPTAGYRRPVPVGQQHLQHAWPLQGAERRNGFHCAAFARGISGLAGRGRAGRYRSANCTQVSHRQRH